MHHCFLYFVPGTYNVGENSYFLLFAKVSFGMVQSICFNFYVCFRIVCFTHITEMLGLISNENDTWKNCRTHTGKRKFVRRKKNVQTKSCTPLKVPKARVPPRMAWSIIDLKKTALRSLKLSSKVNFVTRSNQASIHYILNLLNVVFFLKSLILTFTVRPSRR